MRKLSQVLLKEYQTLSEYHQIVDDIYFQWIQNQNPILILISGPMGAGKTEFVKKISEHMGFQQVSSPTFAIHQNYRSSHHQMEHVDLYRLESEDEVESSGFWDLFSEAEGMIVVEWPERVALEHFPMNWPLIHIKIDLTESESVQFRRIQVLK